MWSEHCSYKSSRVHLKTLPTDGPRVVQGRAKRRRRRHRRRPRGVFKIESHNHPSFIEPYQGAATGVGGIIRDIFTMGARPIALLNSLRFGPLDPRAAAPHPRGCRRRHRRVRQQHRHPDRRRRGRLRSESMRVTRWSTCCASASRGPTSIVKGTAARRWQPGLLCRRQDRPRRHPRRDDGIGRVRREIGRERPAVQVGDPFIEKLLLEACLELMKTDALVGIQDMGAAGLTCSTSEMGAAAEWVSKSTSRSCRSARRA